MTNKNKLLTFSEYDDTLRVMGFQSGDECGPIQVNENGELYVETVNLRGGYELNNESLIDYSIDEEFDEMNEDIEDLVDIFSKNDRY